MKSYFFFKQRVSPKPYSLGDIYHAQIQCTISYEWFVSKVSGVCSDCEDGAEI